MAEQLVYAPIFIVDDSKEDLSLLERVLHQCKLLNPIMTSKSGEECLTLFGLTTVTPVLVMLDLIMAPTNGLQVLRTLKERGLTDRSNIVMLSGIRDIKIIHEGYQLGARTFLIKPVTVEDIVQLLSGLTRIQINDLPDGYLLENVTGAQTARDTAFFRRKGAAFPA